MIGDALTNRLAIFGFAIIFLFGVRFWWLSEENQRLATSLQASKEAVETLEGNVEGIRTQVDTFSSLLLEIQMRQFQLQDEYNTFEEYIDANSTDESAAADPRWQSFFDSLRDADATTGRNPAAGELPAGGVPDPK